MSTGMYPYAVLAKYCDAAVKDLIDVPFYVDLVLARPVPFGRGASLRLTTATYFLSLWPSVVLGM